MLFLLKIIGAIKLKFIVGLSGRIGCALDKMLADSVVKRGSIFSRAGGPVFRLSFVVVLDSSGHWFGLLADHGGVLFWVELISWVF